MKLERFRLLDQLVSLGLMCGWCAIRRLDVEHNNDENKEKEEL